MMSYMDLSVLEMININIIIDIQRYTHVQKGAVLVALGLFLMEILVMKVLSQQKILKKQKLVKETQKNPVD